MKNQELIHGFSLLETREIKEIRVTAHRYLHKQSGAELIHYQCEDSNKVFNIGFKTVPEDNTGCPHILEHSVLNGSKNFPSKNTFMELIKGSMNTFINAMTSSDMTNYPVASTNDKDFLNLMKVYLDAVFFPKIYTEPNILHQEGWHFELTSEDGELNYRGVVYNEMKGAFSSPDGIIYRKCKLAQFPDTPYGFESGGDPEAIPELSYEKFLDFHRKYYHPDNCKISLYGDLAIEPALKLIDSEYLSHFKAGKTTVEIPLQPAFAKVKHLEMEYPVEDGKPIEDHYYLALNWTYGKTTDPFLPDALSFLAEMLMFLPSSPLKQAIRESGLAKDSSLSLRHDILQPTLSIVCKQVKKENLEPLAKLIKQELKRIVKEGFDKKLVEAVINSREFNLREAQSQRFPKGLVYIFGTQGIWMHGGDPIQSLAFEPMLQEMKRGLSEAYFEKLLEKVMISNKHASRIDFIPVPGLLNKQEEELKAQLAKQKKNLKKSEIQELVKFHKDFTAWQEEPEKPEDLEKIPLLSLEDLDPKAAILPTDKEVYKEFTLLKHELNTNGIVYLKAYFDLKHAEEEDLPWIKLYTSLVDWVNSENFGYAERSNEIDTHTGGISLSLELLNSFTEPDDILPILKLSGKAVKEKTPKLMELAAEYALRPLFDDSERLKTLLKEQKARMEGWVLQAGSRIAIQRMLAPLSQLYHWQDMISGLSYYHFLCSLVSRLDTEIEAFMEELDWVKKTFFSTHNLVISLTASSEDITASIPDLAVLLTSVSQEAYAPVENHYAIRNFNEAIFAPVQVQAVAKGGNFFRKGYSYSGKLRVLNNILSNNYLYQELRVKGGAYGAWSDFTPGGYQYFVSYCDPNLRETLKTYDSVPDFLRNFDCSKREMDKYIIGEISNLDYPNTPEETGNKADIDYLTGFTHEDRQQIRSEVLSTKLEDIHFYADMLEAILTKDHYCAFGSESKVKEAAELFDALEPALR
ncbi:MAG TPA: insulinase family protein [Candidatus Cloacimonas sp.]|nr:insulinase family protein [Candidatus Cloacimonas sp.]